MFAQDDASASIVDTLFNTPREVAWDDKPKGIIQDFQQNISNSDSEDENICVVTETHERYVIPTTYIHIDSDGESHRMVDENRERLVCGASKSTKPIKITQGKWTPFFNEIFVSDKNKTILSDGFIRISVVKFGSEGEFLHPFGNNTSEQSIPDKMVFEYVSEDGASGQINGILTKNIHGIPVIHISGLESLPCPIELKTIIKIQK